MARILHVMTSPRAEGTPRLVLDWLSVKSHVQGVVFLTGEPAELLDNFRQTNCWLHVGEAMVQGSRKFWQIAGLARRSTREFRPDLVIAWPNGFSHWVFLGARSSGSRAALLSHAGNPPGTSWRERYAMTWLCVWSSALCGGRMVACSRYVQRLFRGIPLVPGSRIEFAYNSVQAAPIGQKSAAARAARPAGGVFRAIMVATLEAHKDHATLLRAAKILVDRAVRFELFIVGAGRLETALKELAHSLGLGDSVRFLGARADVPELLGQCDLFVLSTTPQEGRPGVILEALAAGLPIVASDVAPLREVLEDGRWGQLVPPANPELLAAAMEVALPSALAERDNRGPAEARRAYALGFSPERMLGDYLRLARRGAVAPSLS